METYTMESASVLFTLEQGGQFSSWTHLLVLDVKTHLASRGPESTAQGWAAETGVPALPLTSCTTLDRILNLSVLYFPPL